MFKKLGLKLQNDVEYHESIDEMNTDRAILSAFFLEGLQLTGRATEYCEDVEKCCVLIWHRAGWRNRARQLLVPDSVYDCCQPRYDDRNLLRRRPYRLAETELDLICKDGLQSARLIMKKAMCRGGRTSPANKRSGMISQTVPLSASHGPNAIVKKSGVAEGNDGVNHATQRGTVSLYAITPTMLAAASS